jgi:acyl carrier protein
VEGIQTTNQAAAAVGAKPDSQEIFARVQRIVALSLLIDESEVTPESRIVEDLGGESLDFLDIIFRVEKEFGIEFPKENWVERESLRYKEMHGLPPDAPCHLVQDGVLTDAGLELMRQRMPEVDQSRIVSGLREDDIVTLVNVFTFVNAIERLLRGEDV